MKIYTTFKALILSSVSTPSKDGKNTYYKLSLMDLISKEAGTVSCTEEVANTLIPMTGYECVGLFDNTYNPPSFRVTHVTRLPEQNKDFGQAGIGQPASSGTSKK